MVCPRFLLVNCIAALVIGAAGVRAEETAAESEMRAKAIQLERQRVLDRAKKIATEMKEAAEALQGNSTKKKGFQFKFRTSPKAEPTWMLERSGVGEYVLPSINGIVVAPRRPTANKSDASTSIATDLTEKVTSIRKVIKAARSGGLSRNEIMQRFEDITIGSNIPDCFDHEDLGASNTRSLAELIDRLAIYGRRICDKADVLPRSVGALAKQDTAGVLAPLCTVTLVAPNIAITAAHCFCGDVSDESSCKKAGILGVDHKINAEKRSNYRIFFQHAGWCALESVEIPSEPSYAGILSDLALVTLADQHARDEKKCHNASDLLTAEMQTSGNPDGAEARVVGFGITNEASISGLKSKNSGSTPLGLKVGARSKVVPWCKDARKPGCCKGTLDGKTATCRRFEPGDLSGAMCNGDSGGPEFRWVDKRWAIAAVMVEGPKSCWAGGEPDYDLRLAPYEKWLHDRLKQPAATEPLFAGPPMSRLKSSPYWAGGSEIGEIGPFKVENGKRLVVSLNTYLPADTRNWRAELRVYKGNGEKPMCETGPQSSFAVSCSVAGPVPPGDDWRIEYRLSDNLRLVQLVAVDY